VVDRWWTHPFD